MKSGRICTQAFEATGMRGGPAGVHTRNINAPDDREFPVRMAAP
jgi:hypothetical protein